MVLRVNEKKNYRPIQFSGDDASRSAWRKRKRVAGKLEIRNKYHLRMIRITGNMHSRCWRHARPGST